MRCYCQGCIQSHSILTGLTHNEGIRCGPTSPTLKETAFECELPLFPVLFECDVLGLDVGDVGVGVKCIADSNDVCLISYGVLDDGFRRSLCICGDNGSKQAVGFFWAWWCPTQRTKEIVVNDRVIEIGVLKML